MVWPTLGSRTAKDQIRSYFCQLTSSGAGRLLELAAAAAGLLSADTVVALLKLALPSAQQNKLINSSPTRQLLYMASNHVLGSCPDPQGKVKR